MSQTLLGSSRRRRDTFCCYDRGEDHLVDDKGDCVGTLTQTYEALTRNLCSG